MAAKKYNSGTQNDRSAENSPEKSLELPIPHHMQDKQGFCGAACIMMLLGDKGTGKSQSQLMRNIKDARAVEWEKKPDPPSARVAWHASPEELAFVLEDEAGDRSWEAQYDVKPATLMKNIDDSLARQHGAIALVWSPNLGTSLPHWVVISGRTTRSNSTTGYWVLDPTAATRHDLELRYESFRHIPAEKGACPCQKWKDASGREYTAQPTWVPKDKFEEMLDEGAVRGNGLRYAILSAGKDTEGPEPNPRARIKAQVSRSAGSGRRSTDRKPKGMKRPTPLKKK